MNKNKFSLIVGLATVLVSAFSPEAARSQDTRNWGSPAVGLWQWGNTWTQNSSPANGTQAYIGNNNFTISTNNSGVTFSRVIFQSGATSDRTIQSGISLTDWNFGAFLAKIENNSAATHTINDSVGLNGGNTVYEINATDGNLTINGGSGSITNLSSGKSLYFYGNNSKTLTINDGIKGGSGMVALKQSNNVILNGTSTYTGNTEIDAGTLTIGGSIDSGSVVYVGSGSAGKDATLALTGTSALNNSLQINVGSGSRTISKTDGTSQTMGGAITNSNNATFSIGNAAGNLNLSGIVSGTGNMTKSGSGTLVLSGSSDNTMSGTTSLNQGVMVLNKTAGVDALNGSITIASGAVLTNAAANQIDDGDGVTISSNGTWALGGNNETVASLDVDGSLALGTAQLIVNGTSSTWSGTVSGTSGSSIVFKANTTDIQGNNTGLASGSAIYVVGGVVGLNNNNAAGSSTIYLGETSGGNNATIDSSVSGTTIGNNIVVRTGSTGTRTIDNATGTGSRAITLNGGVDLQDTVFVNSSASENITFGGVIDNSGSIVKQGAGTMTLGAVNTMSGGVFVDDGTLVVASGADLTAASNVTIGTANFSSDAALNLASGAAGLDRTINVASGAGTRTLSSAGNNTVSGAINQSANLTVSSSSGTLSVDDVTMNTSGNNDLAVGGAGNVNIGGTITAGSGASSVDKSGAGTLTISGDNSGQSYMLNIGGGKVVLDNANALGTSYGDKVNFTANSTLNAATNIGPASLGLRVANGITGTIEVNSGNNLSAATLGSVSGTGTFNKTGTGTLTLTGTSTTANANNVNAGTLFVSSGAALAGTTTVSGGTLAGSGSVGATTIASGGTISPGNSPGTLSLTNGLTWSGGGNYNWQIYNANDALTAGQTNTWDLIAVSGGDFNISGLSSGSKFNINLWSLSSIGPDVNGSAINFNPTQNYRWEILTYTSLNGSTNNLADLFNINTTALNGTGGFQNSVSNGSFSLEVGNGSLDLLFTAFNPTPSAVPEPGTWAAAAMLAGAAGYMRWRRRKQIEPKA